MRGEILQANRMSKLTYHVQGSLIAAESLQPMVGYPIVVESGIRDENSPLCLDGIRVNRKPDGDGHFQAMFVTTGAALEAHETPPIPSLIEVHIEFSRGKWRCREVAVKPDQVVERKGCEVWIDLGRIEVEFEACREPLGWNED
jgi:hypothetical protein